MLYKQTLIDCFSLEKLHLGGRINTFAISRELQFTYSPGFKALRNISSQHHYDVFL